MTAIPLLGIYTEKTIIQKDTCTPILIAALLIIARAWKQPICPLTDEWIKKLLYMYTMEYYSAIKMNACDSVLTRWMNLNLLYEWSKSEREKQVLLIYIYIYSIYLREAQKAGNICILIDDSWCCTADTSTTL